MFFWQIVIQPKNPFQLQLQKRFSMNYLDLVEPQNPRSWQNTITVPASKQQKRFSMNYLDLVDPKDPIRCQSPFLTMTRLLWNLLVKLLC